MNGSDKTEPSSAAAVRIIGYEQDVEKDANAATIMGPKIYIK
jgi:hypothetical protein